MRALVVLSAVAGLLLLAVAHTQVGLYAWAWLTLMQPHQETWGLGGYRLNLVIAVATIVLWLVSKEPKKLPPGPTTALIVAFVAWMVLVQILSLRPSYSWGFFDRFIRVMIFILLCLVLLNTKARIHAMIWVFCIAIGYYGIKGGMFTIVSGGSHRVFGPPSTVISDNNHLGGALVFLLPLLNYLRLQTEARWIRIGLLLTMAPIIFGVLGTHSRGAFVALAVVALPLWWRSRNRLGLAVALVPVTILALSFMPESWYARMDTIEQAGEDASFQGRVDAWVIATKIALSNPLTGAGFRVPYLQEVADIYLSEYRRARAAHSIYFEILGSMGFVGLGLFLAIIALAFGNARWIRRHTASQPQARWAYDLATMAQVSLIGFCVAGASLSLEFWEGPWLLFVILARMRYEFAAQESGAVAEAMPAWYAGDAPRDAPRDAAAGAVGARE